MNKKERIDRIYEILIQFEKISDNDSITTEKTYRNYIDRLYVLFLGYGNEEICCMLKGLYKLGNKTSHDTVKRTVFHIINILDKEG